MFAVVLLLVQTKRSLIYKNECQIILKTTIVNQNCRTYSFAFWENGERFSKINMMNKRIKPQIIIYYKTKSYDWKGLKYIPVFIVETWIHRIDSRTDDSIIWCFHFPVRKLRLLLGFTSGPREWSTRVVHESGPWTRSTKVVHRPGVRVLSFPSCYHLGHYIGWHLCM
jgi:hypothetical protein